MIEQVMSNINFKGYNYLTCTASAVGDMTVDISNGQLLVYNGADWDALYETSASKSTLLELISNCPNCGAPLQFDSSDTVCKCEYCGTSHFVRKQH